ncbi:uncharacterized protein TNCV_1429931 [Trichonephila clavipes]|nr:uncharacterized protein TNCV_1429931 [Trichonephila clavipes]
MVLSKTSWIRHSIQGFKIISNGILAIFDWSPEVYEFEGGQRSFSICTKCNISPFSPKKILQCLRFSCEEAVAFPLAVLRLCTDVWTHGSGLVSLDKMGISPITTMKF